MSDETMSGFDELGFDYMNLVKGLAGGLQGAGGLMSSQQQAQQPQQSQQQQYAPASTEAAQLRLQMEKQQAERSASTTKIILGLLAGVLGLGLVIALATRK
jgi:membrane protease subunit (stomatin/prohibitin family)